jgi:hypothetical protein
LPDIRLAIGYCLGGAGAVAAGISGIIFLGDWFLQPIDSCGPTSTLGVCGRILRQMGSSQNVFAIGVALVAAALLLSTQRTRLAAGLFKMFGISIILMLAFWFVGMINSGSF